MYRVVAAVFPGRHDSTSPLAVGLAESVLTAEVRILTGDEAVYSARQPGAISAARRKWAAIAAVIVAVALGMWVGLLFGSGALNAQDRYNAELLGAQQGSVMSYGPAEVYGHPGAGTVVERQDFIRRVVGLDGVN